MRLATVITLLLALPALAEAEDLLRFKNGDQLHGVFSGLEEGPAVLWKRDDVSGEVKFRSADLRQIVLRGGRPEKSLQSLSHIGTVNGDRIPGTVREMDDKRLLLETQFGGMLELPRDQVGLIAPAPLGGRVLYNGPFEASEWQMIDQMHPDGLPLDGQKPEPAEKDDAKAEDFPLWNFSGSAWYWQNKKPGTALVRKTGVPDRAIIRFDMAWKNRLGIALAFHSDFSQPVPNEEEAKENDGKLAPAEHPSQPRALPRYFGRSYVLEIYSNYVALYRTSFDEEGHMQMPEQVRTNHSGMRLGDSGKASFELRCNRESGEIVLFVDGEFVAQWSELNEAGEGSGYIAPGEGIGFLVKSEDSPVRLSEIVIAEWNGMPDAARSLQVDNTDIVLLANGTDRFSGAVSKVAAGKLYLESRYGDFEFPLEDVAEIRFAKNKLAKETAAPSDVIVARLHPLGRITGTPLRGDANSLSLFTGPAGEIHLNLDSAVMLEFQPSASFLDDWDIDF